jgi:hypothetical protein
MMSLKQQGNHTEMNRTMKTPTNSMGVSSRWVFIRMWKDDAHVLIRI